MCKCGHVIEEGGGSKGEKNRDKKTSTADVGQSDAQTDAHQQTG